MALSNDSYTVLVFVSKTDVCIERFKPYEKVEYALKTPYLTVQSIEMGYILFPKDYGAFNLSSFLAP